MNTVNLKEHPFRETIYESESRAVIRAVNESYPSHLRVHSYQKASDSSLQKGQSANNVLTFDCWDFPKLDAVQQTACRLRDMWDAAGQQPIKSLEFSRAAGCCQPNGATMLRKAAREGLVKRLERRQGWIPLLQEAN